LLSLIAKLSTAVPNAAVAGSGVTLVTLQGVLLSKKFVLIWQCTSCPGTTAEAAAEGAEAEIGTAIRGSGG